MNVVRTPVWIVLLTSCACGVAGDELPPDAPTAAVIYDADDRREVFEERDHAVRALARSSAVAIVPSRRIRASPDGALLLRAATLRETTDLCASERFAEQPAAAECSGVLIDRDLVLTASHCFASVPCASYSFVFDYLYDADTTPSRFDREDVYQCAELISQRRSEPGDAAQIDFAVVRLDRPVNAAREPVALRAGALENDEALVTVGFPSGLPAKIDRGGRVRTTRAVEGDFFEIDADTFRYSSGSGVFDASGRLAGVIVRGREDYMWTGTCSAPVRVAADDVRRWEDATYVGHAIDAVCNGGGSHALCAAWSARADEGRLEHDGAAGCSAVPRRTSAPGLGWAWLVTMVMVGRRTWRLRARGGSASNRVPGNPRVVRR